MRLDSRLLIVVAAAVAAAGFALGYWFASGSSLLDTLDLGAERVEKARYEAVQESLKEAADTAREAQEQARKSREQAEVKVRTARQESERARRTMEAEKARLERSRSDLEKRAAEAEAEEAHARMELEAAASRPECDFSDQVRRLTAAHSKRISIFQEEIHGLRLVVQVQDATISTLRDENLSLGMLTTELRRENGSLAKRLEISTQQFEEAEKRIRKLSGRRLRLRPAALAGAFRGVNGGWSPGFGVGIALTW